MWYILLFAQLTDNMSTDVSPVPLIIAGAIMLILTIFMVMAMWKVFTKSGKPDWACLIPIYNVIVMLEMIGRPWWYAIALFIPPLPVMLGVFLAFGLARSFGKGIMFALGLTLLPPIFFLILGFGSAEYVGPKGPSYRR